MVACTPLKTFEYTICAPGHVIYKSLCSWRLYFALQMELYAAMIQFTLEIKVLEEFWGIENAP